MLESQGGDGFSCKSSINYEGNHGLSEGMRVMDCQMSRGSWASPMCLPGFPLAMDCSQHLLCLCSQIMLHFPAVPKDCELSSFLGWISWKTVGFATCDPHLMEHLKATFRHQFPNSWVQTAPCGLVPNMATFVYNSDTKPGY